jgi:D-alanine-D-alanine ligase
MGDFFMNIIVLSGGLSKERDVSLCTGSMVNKALLLKGHNAVQLDVIGDYDVKNSDFTHYIETCRMREGLELYVSTKTPDIQKLTAEIEAKGNGVFGKNVLALCMAADIVFMALHGDDGEDGKIQATFDMLRVKYTGAGYLGSAVAMSKCFTKKVFLTSDVLTPDYIQISKRDFDYKTLDDISLPCVVKLSSSGSSIGIYIVDNKQDLISAVKTGFSLEGDMIIEQYIEGREFTCGILGDTALPLVEIIPNEGFYDYEHKYQVGATQEICPANLDEENTKRMQAIALQAHYALSLEVCSRSDFILGEDGEIYCLETNTLPGMTPTSLLPQQAAAIGMCYEDLCEKIIMLSLEKYC